MLKNIFPKSVNPPKLVKKYGVQLGWLVAFVNMVFALIHLIRIDTLAEILKKVLAINTTLVGLTVAMIVIAEVFSLPFLLRMKLSTLGHILSGWFVVLVPLIWSAISIWTLGFDTLTGQLGQFVTLPSSVPLVTLNIAWLSLSFITLWALGYNNLNTRDILKDFNPKKTAKKTAKKR